MKITRRQLKQIIKEESEAVLNEYVLQTHVPREAEPVPETPSQLTSPEHRDLFEPGTTIWRRSYDDEGGYEFVDPQRIADLDEPLRNRANELRQQFLLDFPDLEDRREHVISWDYMDPPSPAVYDRLPRGYEHT